MGGTDWILLSYSNGDPYSQHCKQTNRTTNIMIVCDPVNLKGKFQILEERKKKETGYCYYLFELSSSIACTITPVKKGLSSGSIFCIIFFTLIGIYFSVGFLYKRLVIGAKGIEQVPNYSFWKDFGNLQADGCDFICRCGPRHEEHAYRGIDDQLPKEEDDRDDQLLAM
ncbi:cation-dependent mannose-6-phosphate receptor-like isoform X2 [Limulus polyphemus]|uniref:Cation-dependent mannose-6-phosphate receptor-like isoform X2 n=1 Tax=Limulus polyphemus TaxID=6850 RepID=A0ABM1BK73_LIMPO|nr:cation-dependent mannose-6-phosphate receptor-like isoform X2 [Limulus polyphemus]